MDGISIMSKVYKIRRKSDGKFSAGHHRYEVLWEPQGKIWFRLGHLASHLKFIQKVDGDVNSQYRECEIVTFDLVVSDAEDIPL